MKEYIIRFRTKSDRIGYSIIHAPSVNMAQSILEKQGRYREEIYIIEDIEERCPICSEYSIVSEGATDPDNINISTNIKPFKERTKINKYLYTLQLSEPHNYSYAYQYFKDNTSPNIGGCSAVKKGNYFARNYDWYYDNTIEFIIKTPAINNRYKSIAVAAYPRITEGTIDNYEYYKILPFYTLDGINEYGVCCTINVVPGNETGWVSTTGTTPEIEEKVKMCMLMIPRFVLDNFKTATEAAEYLRDYCSIYTPVTQAMEGYECHFMISDLTTSVIVEFVDNTIKILNNKNIITNFRLFGTSNNQDGTIDYTTVSELGSGLERYNKISKAYNSLSSKEDFISLMSEDLKYTNAYNRNINPYWYTEFVGLYSQGKLTVNDAYEHPENYDNIVNIAIDRYENRIRGDYKSWQTVHTSVYDILNKTLTVINQEDNSTEYTFKL